MIIDMVLGCAEGRGGLETVLTLVTNELKRRGHRVRVFQRNKPYYIEWESTIPEIYYYDTEHWKENISYNEEYPLFRYALGYRKLLQELGTPDVVIATHTPLYSLVCKLALSYLGNERPPILSWLHGPPEAYGGESLLRYSNSHILIATEIGKKIQQCIGNEAIVYYVGNPIDMTYISRVKRSEDKLQLIYLGRLESNQKRLDVLINALQDLKGNWNLKLIGDGSYRDIILNMAKEFNIDSKINWIGWKEEPWKYVDEASVLVLTSDYEGFGMVVVEALARGIPVITTDCTGPRELIKDNHNGWFFPIGDYQALTSILQDILDKKMSLPSQEICEQSIRRFKIEAVVDSFEKAILYTKAFYKS